MTSATAPKFSEARSVSTSASPTGRFVAAVLLLATVVGTVAAWYGGDLFVFDDAVSYLDLADAWLRHDWSSVANGYWSPGYSWVLAAGLGIVHPSGYWEPVLVRAICLLLYVVALFCFVLFWRELTLQINRRATAMGIERPVTGRSWFLFGIALFLYCALQMIGVHRASPDMAVAAIVFLLCTVLLRIKDREDRWSPYLYLGILLAIGYYVKAVMFPLGFAFIVAAALAARNRRQGVLRASVSLMIFLVLSSPWILVLSRAKGRLTFGDSGRLNYLWYDNYGWSGDGYPFPWPASAAGTPVHPMRQLADSPQVYEFSAPFRGSYPPWNDPSYWYEGAKTRLNLGLQVKRFLSSAASYERILQGQSAVLAGVLFLFLLGQGWKRGRLKIPWYLLFPAVAGLALYMPVLADNRYVAPFFLLIWSALFSELYLSHLSERGQILAPLALAMAVALLVPIGTSAAADMEQTLGRLRAGAAFDHSDAQVADYLHSMGVRPGDRVAYIQSPGDIFNKYWARLAKVTIVADVPYQDADEFWTGDTAIREKVIQAFSSAGARAVIAYKVPNGVRNAGWHEVGKSDYYVLPCGELAAP